MNVLGRIVLAIAVVPLVAIVLWLVIAATDDPRGYLALTRSGLLLVGLGTLVWGVLWLRPGVASLGLLFIAIGFATFALGVPGVAPEASDGPVIAGQAERLGRGLAQPLDTQ